MQIYEKINNMKKWKQARIEMVEAEMAEYDENISEYARNVAKFSKFNGEDIKEILAKLMWTYEGEEYVPMQVSYTFSRYFEINGGYFQQYTNKPLIVVAEKQACESYDDNSNDLMPLIIDGKAIVLADIYYEGSSIFFYSSCGQGITFHGDIRVPYVRTFIDMVINYRIKNNLENIDRWMLEELLADFLIENKKAIAEYKISKRSSLEKPASTEEQQKKLTKATTTNNTLDA